MDGECGMGRIKDSKQTGVEYENTDERESMLCTGKFSMTLRLFPERLSFLSFRLEQVGK
jgi:hypothetical protein